MELLTRTERQEFKLYLTRRLSNDDLSDLQLRDMVGIVKLLPSGFWAADLVSEIIHEYLSGERNQPAGALTKLAEIIDVIQGAANNPAMLRRLTGKRPEKAPEQPAAGPGGAEVRP